MAVPVVVAGAIGFGTSLSGLTGGLSELASGPEDTAAPGPSVPASRSLDRTLIALSGAPSDGGGGAGGGGGGDNGGGADNDGGSIVQAPGGSGGGGGDDGGGQNGGGGSGLPDISLPGGGGGGGGGVGGGGGDPVGDLLDGVGAGGVLP